MIIKYQNNWTETATNEIRDKFRGQLKREIFLTQKQITVLLTCNCEANIYLKYLFMHLNLFKDPF